MQQVKTLDNDYGLKIALINEYKKTLEFKKMYEDLVESFQYIVGDLFDYARKNRIDLPNRDRVYRNIEKAQKLIEYRISNSERLIPPTENKHYFPPTENKHYFPPTESQQRNKTPDDETEPSLLDN